MFNLDHSFERPQEDIGSWYDSNDRPAMMAAAISSHAQGAKPSRGCVGVSWSMESFAKHVFENDTKYTTLIEKEMSALSVDERDKIYEMVHGVDKPTEETPDFVEKKLEELNFAITMISSKQAYNLAEQKDYAYVHNWNFRLMFLRADMFDTYKAATRMVDFFKTKLEIFGEATLTRPVYFSDLDDGTQECVKSGICQLLPTRDRSGRTVLAIFDRVVPTPYKDSMEMVRTLAYTSMTNMEDDLTQRNGVVGLLYFIGPHPMNCDIKLNSEAARTLEWLPVRFCAQHYCTDHRVVKALTNLLVLSWNKQIRTKLRIHNGTHTECQYALLSYGIPTSSLPISYDGSLKLANHQAWLRKQLAKDEELKRTSHDSWGFGGIDLPGNRDILIGRGKSCQDHSGNIAMRDLCEVFFDEYVNAVSKKVKTQVTWKAVNEIKEKGGRFLEKDSIGWWREVTDNDRAREKVSMLLRMMAHKEKAEKKKVAASGSSRSSSSKASNAASSYVASGGANTKRTKTSH